MGIDYTTWATCLVLILATTAFFSRTPADVKREHQRSPPTLPLALPLIGHLPEFLWNTERLLARAAKRFGPKTPVQLRLLNRRLTILNGATNIITLFKGSRAVNSEHWLVQVLVNAFGVLVADAPFYYADDTGVNQQPAPGSNPIPTEHRIFHLVYHTVHDGLSGARLDEMQRQMVSNLATQLSLPDIKHNEWTVIDDLYGSLIRKICFTASTTSLCGPRIFEAAPELEADFWDFDGHLPTLFKEMPQWLFPQAYRARSRMKDNIKRWHELAHKGYDIGMSATDASNWEPNFGSKLMRNRHAFFEKMPLSKDTIAADDLGLLWAATANAIPAIGWMILEVVQRPALLDRVRAEIAPHIDSSSLERQGHPSIDIDGLCQEPLIQSIYAEVLRVHNGTVIARVPQTPDFSIDGWTFPKGQPIMVSSYDTAREPSVWNQGTSEDPHPVDEFWPERFLVDPTNPASGPTRRLQKDASDAPMDTKGATPYFSLEGTAGSWVPYGGGARMCPGRHFAKKELIVAMTMFLDTFDIELTHSDSWVRDDPRYFMFGVMHPKGPIQARVRRRRTGEV